MLMMVTSRRLRSGTYQDQEQSNFGYHYLSGHRNGPPGDDGFDTRGKSRFEAALLRELNRLKEAGVNTPKVGIYLHGYNNNYQESIDEIFDLERALGDVIGYSPIMIGFSWPSSGTLRGYLSDREEVRDSVPAFCSRRPDSTPIPALPSPAATVAIRAAWRRSWAVTASRASPTI